MRAVVLLSGGVESATLLALAQRGRAEVYTLTVDYGQRHRRELAAARSIAAAAGVPHVELTCDLRPALQSALLGDGAVRTTGVEPGEPGTYVPARNTVLLALALGYAETVGADEILYGASATDADGYPDCRPPFVAAFNALAQLATWRGAVGVHAPLIEMTKAQVIALGLELGVDYAATWSCYDPRVATPCGVCDACRLRHEAFLANE